ncbi:hypothetical protein [Actinoplanes rectilineatus]|uniref:phage tail tube protein n=1 Tax=Actinoplanes rectilineatus TaxID=113571 RepID=UPI0005F2D423|nr:hypothetical protein [Actinoplanes rectilineatus]
MADIISDGMTRVAWLANIANIGSVTLAELSVGILLHDTMTPTGLASFQPATAAVATGKFSSRFDTNKPGRVSYSDPKLQFYRQDGVDTIWNTLAYGTVGFVVVRRSLAAETAWAATQRIRVYPATCGERIELDPEPNTLERWESPLFVHSQPNLNALVAA